MIYEFLDDAGDAVEIYMPASDAPPIGDVIERDGRRLVRVASRSGVIVRSFGGYASAMLPRWSPHATRHDKHGRAIVGSIAEQREILARYNDDPVTKHRLEADRD